VDECQVSQSSVVVPNGGEGISALMLMCVGFDSEGKVTMDVLSFLFDL